MLSHKALKTSHHQTAIGYARFFNLSLEIAQVFDGWLDALIAPVAKVSGASPWHILNPTSHQSWLSVKHKGRTHACSGGRRRLLLSRLTLPSVFADEIQP